jgi:hypothetical protein
MNKKLLITLGAASIIVVATVASAGIMAFNSCGYDKKTGYYLYDGNKVSAYGTMDSAMKCAMQGILPDVVANRLGKWGNAETKEEADNIILMDSIKKEENRRTKDKKE